MKKTCLLPALLFLSQCARQPITPVQPQWQQAPQPRYAATPPPAAYAPPPVTYSPPPANAAPRGHYMWQRSSSVRTQSLGSGAELHEFSARGVSETAEVRVVVFDSQRCSLRVLDQPSANAGSGVITPLMRSAGALAGVNGGFFHPDFRPLGLMISDGRRAGQFTRTSLVSGSFLTIGQEPYLVWNAEFMGERGVNQMLQAGPRLVDNGFALTSLNRTKHATRTFIATDGKRQWALGTVRGITLAGLGELLASPGVLPGLQAQRALNLDGGRSTAFYARTPGGRELAEPGWSTVRNYLAVVPSVR